MTAPSQVWQHVTIITAVRNLRQRTMSFEATLGYIVNLKMQYNTKLNSSIYISLPHLWMNLYQLFNM